MRPILSDDARGVLDALARERALLVFDFDGTLAPIVERPPDAAMRASTRALLRVVSLLYPCAVISGRSRADLAPRLSGVPLLAFVGNHGAEAGFGPVDRSPRPEVAGWVGALREALAGAQGIEIEDKGLSVAIHYRRAPDRETARRLALGAAELLEGVRVFGGLAVVNVAPADAPDKGAAVGALLARIGWRQALYVGDDVTDEDAFSAEGVTVSVRVGERPGSAARFCLPAQEDVDALLRELAAARRRLDGRGEGIEGLVRASAPVR
jgi:trehalose 6-phosphate phosphatase